MSVTISTGVINLHQGQKSKYHIFLSQWTDAFLIFWAIYLVKFPQEGQNLLKYCQMGIEMQYLHGHNVFRLYDEQFRKLKESVNIPWQNAVQELRLCCNCKSSILKTGPISAALSCKNLFTIQQRGTLASSSIVACNAKPPIQKNKCPDVLKYQFSKPSNPGQSNKTS